MPAMRKQYGATDYRKTIKYGSACETNQLTVLSNIYIYLHTLPLPKTLVGVLYFYIAHQLAE